MAGLAAVLLIGVTACTPVSPEVQRAQTPVENNADWTPHMEIINNIEYMLVPAGCFTMGSDEHREEAPAHEQCFDKPFWIGMYEVTNAMYDRCVEAGACREARASDYSPQPDQPVVNITWDRAREYAAWVGGRLPTEAEWEYAARGPDNLIYPWGNDFRERYLAWYGSSGGHTVFVNSFRTDMSWVGAYGMGGNVFEWTSSLFAPYPYDRNDGRERTPGEDEAVRVIMRGNMWWSYRGELRLTVRNAMDPTLRADNRGFRVARDT